MAGFATEPSQTTSGDGGGGGGGTVNVTNNITVEAADPEVLFDNTGGAGVIINVDGGFAASSTNEGLFAFSDDRALGEDDDNKHIVIAAEYVAGTNSVRRTKHFSYLMSARQFRLMDTIAASAGDSDNTISYYVERQNTNSLTGWGEGRFILARGRSADGGDILRVAAAATSGTADITGFKIKIDLVTLAGAAKVTSIIEGGGGSSLTPVTWAEATEPAAATVGLIENIEGVEYVHDVKHHDAHTKLVTWGTLIDPHFRGFHHNSNLISNPAVSVGDFFTNLTYGDFEIRREAPTGDEGYNPFGVDEPWETATGNDADGNEVTVDTVYRGMVRLLSSAFRRATAVGQVFAVSDLGEIRVVLDYTASAVESDEYFRRLYRPPTPYEKPYMVFWGFGQT